MAVPERTFVVPANPNVQPTEPFRFVFKSAGASLDYYLDLRGFLTPRGINGVVATADTVSSFEVASNDPALTVTPLPLDGSTCVGAMISGGVAGTDYGLRWDVTTAFPRTIEVDAYLMVAPYGAQSAVPAISMGETGIAGLNGTNGTNGINGTNGYGVPSTATAHNGYVLATDNTGQAVWIDPSALNDTIDLGWF